MGFRKILLPAAVAAGFAPAVTLATNGYQLIGVGGYQKSLAGATTANPGSAMTASTNPAGMARIGNRADFSMELFMPDRSVDFTGTGGNKEDSSVDNYGVPAIGWTAPTSEGSKFYFGGGMFGTSGLGVDYGSTRMAPGYPSPADPTTLVPDPTYFDGYSNIAFWQMAPALAWNQSDRLTLGVGLNLDYQSVAFQQRVLADTDGDGQGDQLLSNFNLSRGASNFGYGFNLGLIYDVNEQITVGASYESKQEFADMQYQLARGDITNATPGAVNCTLTAQGDVCPAGTYKLNLDFPQQAALGIAVRPNDAITVSADLKWIDWSDTMDKLSVKGPNGVSIAMDPGWDDQTVYAIGVAWDVNPKLVLRAGYNYAKTPFNGSEVSRNLILPGVVESHYTFGGDYQVNKHWGVGFHYMYVPEVSFTAPAADTMAPNAKVSLSEQSLGVNIGYSF